MKLKVVVLDLELTRWQRRGLGVLGGFLAVGLGSVAFANVPNTFTPGQTLTAADLNSNFADLDSRATALDSSTAALAGRVTLLETAATNSDDRAASLETSMADVDARVAALEAGPTAAIASSSTGEVGIENNLPTVYTHADLVLAPGTWLVQGYAGLTIATNDDSAGLGLFNVTQDSDVPNSYGPIATIAMTGPVVGFSTAQTVITVTETTIVRLKARQNGLSLISFFDYLSPSLAPLQALGPHKLTAVRLR